MKPLYSFAIALPCAFALQNFAYSAPKVAPQEPHINDLIAQAEPGTEPGWIAAKFIEERGGHCFYEIGGAILQTDSLTCPKRVEINPSTGQWRGL